MIFKLGKESLRDKNRKFIIFMMLGVKMLNKIIVNLI